MRRLRLPVSALLASALLAAALVAADLAGACSCIPATAREGLPEADAAVIGTVVAGGDPARLRVDEAVKGDLPAELLLENSGDSGTCGLDLERGDEVGLLLYGGDDGWEAGSCGQYDPDTLRRAAAPLPEPVAGGPPALIAAGRFSGRRLVALDADGRLLGYGFGRGVPADVAACPGAQRLVELVGTRRLVVRRLPDLAVLDRTSAPRKTRSIACRDAGATRLVALVSDYATPVATGRLVSLHRGRVTRTLRRGTLDSVTFDGDTAYLSEGRWGRDLTAVDVRTGRVTRIARTPSRPSGWVVSPDGRHLAAVAHGSLPEGRSATVLVDRRARRGARVLKRPAIADAGGLAWLDSARLLASGSRLLVNDLRLRTVLRGRTAFPYASLVRAAGRVYGLSSDRLIEIAPPTLRAREVAGLPSERLDRLYAVPGATAAPRALVARARRDCPR